MFSANLVHHRDVVRSRLIQWPLAVVVLIGGLAASPAVAADSGSSTAGQVQAPVVAGKKPKVPSFRVTPPPRRVGVLDSGVFGIHSYQGKPGLTAGSYRHNCYPLWRKMNPEKGVYDWSVADEYIDKAAGEMGFSDVMFSFCGTPAWAASGPVKNPSREYWGESSTAAPKDMEDWRTFLREFISRYSSRISAYEAWNEATAQYLWQGTPDEMAQMTKILYDVVQELDPSARVISANSQMGEQPAWFAYFFPRYMKGLAARGWPVDVVAIHSYAGHPDKIAAEEGVVKRAQTLDILVAAVKRAKIPSRIELWDTETNYLGKAQPRLQQAMVMRTYLDSWAHGLKRTYWYMWVREPYPWLGIQMMDGAPGVVSYNSLVQWTRGTRFVGCGQDRALTICEFQRGAAKFQIAYATQYRGRQKLAVSGPTTVCEPTGAPCRQVSKSVTVTYMPVKIG